MEENGALDFFDAPIVMAFIVAAIADFFLLLTVGVAIPVVGIVFIFIIAASHYLAALPLFFLVFPKLRHFVPKLVLTLFAVLPLPLTVGTAIAIAAQNRIIEQLVVQGATQIGTAVAAALTAPAGGVGGAVVETTGQAMATTAKGTELAGAGVRTGAGALKEAGAVGREAPGRVAEGAAPKQISGEALGEEKSTFKKLLEHMEELPTPEEPRAETEEEKSEEGPLLDDETNNVDLRT